MNSTAFRASAYRSLDWAICLERCGAPKNQVDNVLLHAAFCEATANRLQSQGR